VGGVSHRSCMNTMGTADDRPPIQEGHHVTGMRDLVGAETEEKLRSDREWTCPSSTFDRAHPQ
jgi:hypothetical protein